jgi:hypothetical protein
MDNKYRLGSCCYPLRDPLSVDIPCIELAVDQYGGGPDAHDGRRTRDDSERWQNNLIPGPNRKCGDGKVERHRAIADRNSMVSINTESKFFF